MNEVINIVADHWGLTLQEISEMTIPHFNELVELTMKQRRKMFVGGTYADYVLQKHDPISPKKHVIPHMMAINPDWIT